MAKAKKKKAKKKKSDTQRRYAPKVSLAPLTFEQAVEGFLQVKPDKPPVTNDI